jgi:hypothetical protein
VGVSPGDPGHSLSDYGRGRAYTRRAMAITPSAPVALDISSAARVHLAYSQRGDERGQRIARVAQQALPGAPDRVQRALEELLAILATVAAEDDEELTVAEDILLLEWERHSSRPPS